MTVSEQVKDNSNNNKGAQQKNKGNKKEKKKAVKAQIASTKVIRIRWRQANPNLKPKPVKEAAPAEKEREEKKNLRRAAKGCYVGANIKGDLKFNGGIGVRSIWLCHSLTNGDCMFSPLSAPKRYLRVFPDGTVDLSNGGTGPRTRWGLVQGEGEGLKTRLLSRFAPNLHLAALSAGKKLKTKLPKAEAAPLRKVKKEKVTPRAVDAAHPPANLLSDNFGIEEVDPIELLKKMASRKTQKKIVERKAAKQTQKVAKKKVPTKKPRTGKCQKKCKGQQQATTSTAPTSSSSSS